MGREQASCILRPPCCLALRQAVTGQSFKQSINQAIADERQEQLVCCAVLRRCNAVMLLRHCGRLSGRRS